MIVVLSAFYVRADSLNRARMSFLNWKLKIENGGREDSFQNTKHRFPIVLVYLELTVKL